MTLSAAAQYNRTSQASLRTHLQRANRLSALVLLALALSGCQGITGTSLYTQVRFIDTSPDAPGLDLYQNSTATLYNVGFGTVSSYIPISPGTYTYSADAAGTQQAIITSRATLASGSQYTVLAGNTSAALQLTVLKDQAAPAPAGHIALRILDQATRAGAVDIYLVPSTGTLNTTAPTLSKATFGNTPVYLDLPSGTYSIVVLPSGSSTVVTTTTTSTTNGTTTTTTTTTNAVPALYTGNQIAYPGASARTVILLDQPLTSPPGVQVISAIDFDPPTATN